MQNNTEKKWILKTCKAIFCSLFVIACGFSLWRASGGSSSVTHIDASDIKIEEIVARLGIQSVHGMDNLGQTAVKKLAPWLMSTGAGVAVADVNSDGFEDLFFPTTKNGAPNSLYINNRAGGFSEQSEAFGLKFLRNGVSRALFFDCNNDGQKEVFLSTTACPLLMKKNQEGKFEEISFLQDSSQCFWSMAVNIFDYDNDGLLDIIQAGFHPKWMNVLEWKSFLPTSFVSANNGGSVWVYKNQGECKFTAANDLLSESRKKFVHAVGLGDLRGTGNVDIWMATDFSKDTMLYLDEASSKYKYSDAIGLTAANSGMNADVTFLSGSELPYTYVTHVYREGYQIGGNTFWQFDTNKKEFRNFAEQFGIRRCGWSWGAKFADLNNDSKPDLVVANGFISADRKRDFMFKLATIASSSEGFVSDYQYWPGFKGESLSGYERDCLFMSTKDGYKDISEQINFDAEMRDGRGVAIGDFENRGHLSVVVANQMQPPYFYRITQTNENQWVGFVLQGKQANRDGIGAKVTVLLSNQASLVKELFPFNGYASQSDGRLHFGLGKNKVESITIRWPGGHLQKVEDFKLNSYNKVIQK